MAVDIGDYDEKNFEKSLKWTGGKKWILKPRLQMVAGQWDMRFRVFRILRGGGVVAHFFWTPISINKDGPMLGLPPCGAEVLTRISLIFTNWQERSGDLPAGRSIVGF